MTLEQALTEARRFSREPIAYQTVNGMCVLAIKVAGEAHILGRAPSWESALIQYRSRFPWGPRQDGQSDLIDLGVKT